MSRACGRALSSGRAAGLEEAGRTAHRIRKLGPDTGVCSSYLNPPAWGARSSAERSDCELATGPAQVEGGHDPVHQKGRRGQPATGFERSVTLAVRHVEAAGVEFIDENSGGPSMGLRERPSAVPSQS
jgi:hypothetical protein